MARGHKEVENAEFAVGNIESGLRLREVEQASRRLMRLLDDG